MKRALIPVILMVSAAFAAEGTFAGQVVNGPNFGEDASEAKWVYIEGPRDLTRRVDVSKAQVRYAESVPKKTRMEKPEDAIREGAQVRVTASQDKRGEWKASAVEILKAAPQ